jgi:methylated-DNA-[protein]-cysteine S-methyltransferase
MDREQVSERLDEYHLTSFQKKVLLATFDIPKGETRSYKQIAAAAGRPKAFRAVGSIMRNNPMAPIVPCHRVIRSDGKTGNYSGKGGPEGKIRMLKEEGALG